EDERGRRVARLARDAEERRDRDARVLREGGRADPRRRRLPPRRGGRAHLPRDQGARDRRRRGGDHEGSRRPPERVLSVLALDRPLGAAERALARELFLGRGGAEGDAPEVTAGELPYWYLERLVAEPPAAEAAIVPSPAHVALAYRLILQRDPEKPKAVD